MPTNNERREVAARLRKYIDLDFEDSNPYWYVMKAIYGDVAIHGDNELFDRLADLIEPERVLTVTFAVLCPECNKVVGIRESYCGWCGARMVEE